MLLPCRLADTFKWLFLFAALALYMLALTLATSPLGKLVDTVLAILRSGLAATTAARRVDASRACVLANLWQDAPNYV